MYKTEKPTLEWDGDCEDEDSAQIEWEDLKSNLTTIMDKINVKNSYKGYWIAEVTNFGWRSLNGAKSFKADTGEKLLQEVLPDTDCHFKIFVDYRRSKIRIQNFHHDSPMGAEWYNIKPMNKKEAEEFFESN